jgi:thioester reductase-like protein
MLDYKIKLNTQDFYKYRTIENLSNLIDNNIDSSTENIDVDYLKNVNNSFYKHNNKPASIICNNYKNILLLGCTGYLGMHLLYEIINTTNSHITCIIRQKDNKLSVDRFNELYQFYFNETPNFSRITVITADVIKNHFGLSEDAYVELSKTIDLVVNCAANVKYYGNYNDFKKINVTVVEHLIDFCIEKDIKLAHISTLGVSGNYLVNHEKNYNDFDENNFFINQNFKENVYIQTKFEAEELIYNKISQGLKASIFRVGNLTGRYADGLFQKNINDNAFYNILRVILKYGILPDTMLNNLLEFTPIDFCAKALCKLLYNVDFNKFVFHIFNQNYITVREILEIFSSLGFNTTILSGIDFKQRIVELSNQNLKENVLKGIVNDLDDDLGLAFNSTVNQKNLYTNSYLSKVDFEWPNIDIQYIQKIVNYMKKNKYI